MALGTLTLNSGSYTDRDNGNYVLSTITFPDPVKKLMVRPVTTLKSGDNRMSLVYILEKDVTLSSGAIVRKTASATLIIDFSSNNTAAEVDAMVTCLSDAISTTTFSLIAQGSV